MEAYPVDYKIYNVDLMKIQFTIQYGDHKLCSKQES